MLKILVDGEEAHVVLTGANHPCEGRWINPSDHTVELAMELEGTDHPQIVHRFTSEGVIVEGRTDEKVYPISHGMWDQLAADGGMI